MKERCALKQQGSCAVQFRTSARRPYDNYKVAYEQVKVCESQSIADAFDACSVYASKNEVFLVPKIFNVILFEKRVYLQPNRRSDK